MQTPSSSMPASVINTTSNPSHKQLHHKGFLGNVVEICIVTHDHNRTMADLWALGIGPWKIYTFDPSNTTNQTYRGRPCEFTLKVCFAQLDSVVWEIMEPVSGPTIMADFLDQHGEGVHHLAFDCNHIPWQERLDEFRRRGCRLVQTGSWMGRNSFAFFEGERRSRPTTFETYFFPDDWEYPPAEAEYPPASESLPRSPTEAKAEEAQRASPPCHGVAVELEKGQLIKIMNADGKQVAGLWAFAASNLKEYMSMSHTRASTLRLSPQTGDTLVTSLRNPILTLVEDTSSGVHDTLMPTCDAISHRRPGRVGDTHNCSDNLGGALAQVGRSPPASLPDPLNLFMNVAVSNKVDLAVGSLEGEESQFVRFRSEMDCVVVMSPCTQVEAPSAVHFSVGG